ncbi:MAG: hypothetical protein GF408_07660 [Candidatus Omnitrophica bacterium]|nr:hypothetical protein [Candidatus Omnitrophota bacterium]
MRKNRVYFTVIVLLFFLSAEGSPAEASSARVISCGGEVELTPPGRETSGCEPGMVLTKGTNIRTGKASFITLGMDDQNIVNLRQDSSAVLHFSRAGDIELVEGKIFALLREAENRKSGFTVRTPCAVCGARGTGWETETDGHETAVFVFEGEVFCSGIGPEGTPMAREYIIRKGHYRNIRLNDSPGEEKTIPPDRMRALLEEARLASGALGPSEDMGPVEKFSKKDAQRMKSLSDRLERDDVSSRLNRAVDPGTMPVIPGRGGGDDDSRERRERD